MNIKDKEFVGGNIGKSVLGFIYKTHLSILLILSWEELGMGMSKSSYMGLGSLVSVLRIILFMSLMWMICVVLNL